VVELFLLSFVSAFLTQVSKYLIMREVERRRAEREGDQEKEP
jgi:hypothetical protein